MARAVLLKLAAGSHCGQSVRASQDFLIQPVALQSVSGDVAQVLAHRQKSVAELLHMVELLA
jgi:hypothetical protein